MQSPFIALKKQQKLWDLYTRKEEYFPAKTDQYGCFTYSTCTQDQINLPAVSTFLLKNGLTPHYPDDKKFAVCLTHDVDEIYPPFEHMIFSSISAMKELNVNELVRQISWIFTGKQNSPYWNFNEIMDIEQHYDACSTFFFIASNSDIKRFRYDIEDIGEEIGQIIDRGWEVGLHGGFYSYLDSNELKKEKHRIESLTKRDIIGFRNHYLRFKVPDSWHILNEIGIKYDTTLGYNDAIGFRNGMCHPFYPYDLILEKELDILEIPMIIMDSALFDAYPTYEKAWDTVKNLIDHVEQNRGVLTINWHSNNFNCKYKEKWTRMYHKLLEYCNRKNAALTSGEKIFESAIKWSQK